MRILIFGASIVQGFHDGSRGGWVNELAAYTNEKILKSVDDYDVSIFNLGISGDCTNRLLKRFESEAKTRLEGKEGAIVFSIGINDTQRYVNTGKLKTSIEKFENNIRTLIELSRKHTEKIIFFGVLPIIESMVQPMPWASDRAHYEKDLLEFNLKLKEVCGREGVTYAQMQDVYGESRDKLLHDGIHPSAEGHRLIFERVKKVLEAENLL